MEKYQAEIKDYYQEDGLSGVLPLACRAGNFVFFAGGIACHPTRGVPEEIKPPEGFPYHWSKIDQQMRYIYNNMSAVLEKAGSSINRIMKLNTWQTDPKEIFDALSLRKDYFGEESPPPSTLVLVPELLIPGTTVTTDAIAMVNGVDLAWSPYKTVKPIHESIWNRPIFMKRTKGNGFIFTSGKYNYPIGHPDLKYHYDKATVATEFIIDSLRTSLEEEGAALSDVVSVLIHIGRMDTLPGLEEVWLKFFPTYPPARVLVPAFFSHEFACFEMEFIAIDPKGPYRKERVLCTDAPAPFAHEPQAIKAGPYLFLSGQMATDWEHGKAPEAEINPNFPFHSSKIKQEVRYILKNVDAICKAAGTSIQNIVRRRAIHTNLSEYGEAEAVWRETVTNRLPPTTTFKAAGDLPIPACSVQYDLVVFIPEAVR